MKNLENIEFLLDDLSAIVKKDAPHLLRLFEVFAQEARFGREWLATALMKLDANAKILEVGAGLMLLSSQLVKEGYEVVALEPIGDGFSQFAELQKIVLGYASMQKVLPTIKSIPIEHLTETNCYDFAFSINVMEHIESVELSICNISNALKPAVQYKLTTQKFLA